MNGIREPVVKVHSSRSELHLVLVADVHLTFRYILKNMHLRRLRKALRSIKPDILVNTGDLFCRHVVFSPIPLLDKYMHYIGNEWPWAFTWGNHDLETRLDFRDSVDEYLAMSPRCLYARSNKFFLSRSPSMERQLVHETPFYGGNYVVEVYGQTSGSVKPEWLLFFFNSGREAHVPPVVLAWAKEVSARYDYSVPSVCFMHRPIKEMKDRANESTIEGFAFEGVGSAPDKGEMHEMLMAIKTVKACFFGHDHSNNFYCDSGGIRYHSARKSLSLSYGARSCENALFRKNGSRPDIRWGLTSIKLSMNTGALDVKTVLENGDVFQTYRIP